MFSSDDEFYKMTTDFDNAIQCVFIEDRKKEFFIMENF